MPPPPPFGSGAATFDDRRLAAIRDHLRLSLPPLPQPVAGVPEIRFGPPFVPDLRCRRHLSVAERRHLRYCLEESASLQHKTLSVALKILLGVEVCINSCLLVYVVWFADVDVSSLAEGISICSPRRLPPRTLSIIFWMVPLMYGLILLCLALHKTAEYWKMTSGLKGFHLMRVVILDQVLYYGFFILCCVCQTVSYSAIESSPFFATAWNTAGSPILVCILGGHLLLNLKEAGEKGVNGGTSYTPEISDMEFVENGVGNEESPEREGPV